ncbi:MAG TPA: hypothetical protein VL400_19390 [Polyangiaceae bacterium]|nr:hypothetical protein [Polyangiaceae bacterium]
MAAPPSRSKTKIAGTFARAAMGPVEYASSCISSNKIPTGLAELAPDALFEAFRRGVDDVARLVGVSPGAVLAVLPSHELEAVRQRLSVSQPRAVDAWRAHAGQFGFLDAMTALTVDGRRPDIRACLERVAKKLRADRELSEPLAALADDADAWAELLDASRRELENGSALAEALRKKRLLRALVMFVPTLLFVAISAGIVFVRIERSDVDRRLAVADVCLAYDIPASGLSYASSAQRAKLVDLKHACDDRRATEAAAKKEEDERLAAEQKVREERDARVRACTSLADEVARGTLSPASEALAGGSAPLLDRVAKKALEPADLGPDAPAFPCEETPAKERLEAAYGDALLADVSVWTQRSDPSPFVAAALSRVREKIPDNALLGLADNAERTAKSGLTGGDATKIARAKHLCAMAKTLGVPGRGSCNAVLDMK